jgi:CBS domain-containing protein
MTSPRNPISGRVADALRRFPPFSMLPETVAAGLAACADIRVVPMGDLIWKQGAPPGDEVMFLAQGRVEYIWEHDGRTERVDVRDVGDVLGLSALVRGEPFRVTAQAVEDCILYGLPWPRFKDVLDRHDEARNYVRRHLFWAVRVGSQIEYSEPTESSVAGRAKNILQAHLDGAQLVQPRPLERLLTCQPDDTVAGAAALMSAKRVPSILVVDAARRPLGIVSGNSLVKHIIVDGMPKDTPVSRIMANPVVTISPHTSAMAASLLMLRERIGQVCVTEDGTPGTPALDVCTHKDLLAQSGHHPTGMLYEIRIAKSPARFRELCDEIEQIVREYLEAGASAIYVGQICAELYDELAARLLALSIDELAAEGIPLPRGITWAWMSVGSDGRREQILRTDMDNGFVFTPTGAPETDETARQVFLKLAAAVIDKLVAAGFARCQGGVMALNPRWCRTTAEWLAEIESFNAGIDGAMLLRATVLYDLRFVAGERELCDRLRERIYATVSANLPLQHRLAELIVDNTPPLNFIGRFVIEKLGGGGGEFDLKNRGMAPLRDAARLFSLRHKLSRRYSTGGRWDELRRTIPQRGELAALAREAYDHLLRLRTLNGLRRGDSGRHLDPESLTKLERAQLANVFDVVRTVQQAVRMEFATDGARLG